jgi:hypothetical protein
MDRERRVGDSSLVDHHGAPTEGDDNAPGPELGAARDRRRRARHGRDRRARLATAPPGVMVAVVACATLLGLVVARARLAETAHSLSDVAGGITTGMAVTLVAALLLDTRLPSVARDRRAR